MVYKKVKLTHQSHYLFLSLNSDLYVYIAKDGKKIVKTEIKTGLFVMFL